MKTKLKMLIAKVLAGGGAVMGVCARGGGMAARSRLKGRRVSVDPAPAATAAEQVGDVTGPRLLQLQALVAAGVGLSEEEQLAAFEPTAELKAFLDPAAGEKPVYIGWGSMTTRSDNVPNSSVFMTTLAVEAAKLANVRAVILSGWAKLGPEHVPADRTDLKEYAASGRVHFAGRVPHGWLMPKCQSAVVHGGAGTTAAVLKAGIPCIVAPVMPTDQPWWGQRVTALGVGVWLGKTLRNSTAAELAAAIGAVDDTMREKAARLASEINQEDGPAKGADALAALAASAPPPKYPEVRRRQSFTQMGVGSQLNLTASL